MKHIKEGGEGGREKRENTSSVCFGGIVTGPLFLPVSCPSLKSFHSVWWRGYPFIHSYLCLLRGITVWVLESSLDLCILCS